MDKIYGVAKEDITHAIELKESLNAKRIKRKKLDFKIGYNKEQSYYYIGVGNYVLIRDLTESQAKEILNYMLTQNKQVNFYR